jgi:hypothetical protein
MKILPCDLCDKSFESEHFEDWIEQMKSHYAQAHTHTMQANADLPKEEQMEKMGEWMEDARERFDRV